jgi:hypothetical protein
MNKLLTVKEFCAEVLAMPETREWLDSMLLASYPRTLVDTDCLAVGSDLDIDDILKDRRLREINATPEKSEAEMKREADRAEMDKAAGNAIGKVWDIPRG